MGSSYTFKQTRNNKYQINNERTDTNFPEMDHFLDSPIDWSQIDKVSKTNLLKSVQNMFNNYIDPDISVQIGKHVFNCHLLVLKSYSTYFKRQKYGQNLILPEGIVSPMTFATIYHWMLESPEKEARFLTRRSVLDILTAAQYMGISELEEQCWAFIDSPAVFVEETALMLYIEAVARKFQTVAEIMIPKISKAFLPLVASGKFNELQKEVATSLLSSNYIAIHREDEVLGAACNWLLYDWDRRKEFMVEVMRCVRFGLMPPWGLSQIRGDKSKSKIRLIANHPQVQEMIDEGMAYAVCRYSYNENSGDWAKQLDLHVPQTRLWLDDSDQPATNPQDFESEDPCEQIQEKTDKGASGDPDGVALLQASWSTN